jgi:hypothetical protein
MGKHLDKVRLKYGMTTQAQFDTAKSKEDKRKSIVDEYKKSDKVKISKAKLLEFMDELTK